ncbi:hypothetical protein EK21DRAFT_54280 [Setomelanomma holmii]|uniref:Dol-P-Glc:Glc(2)Man(9)GlcNAc(2)-PP-Dol alpha-1,2-glucosyltransferase n=1 Tax=Setomelanomma holmii TaxID=210430 RepID=A0A9P4HJX2_9PLEO|nr:hypothetical protein EK21DRAFT_54280 [Setomelanomma holmii]
MPTLLQTWALPAALLAVANISATWYNVVSREVPEPYLDEFFHIPQAQKYCQGDYSWDPKITTPPGFYGILRMLRTPTTTSFGQPRNGTLPKESSDTSDPSIFSDANTALNIALFPPLFFFSALFYTDVMSTLIVLLSYSVFLKGKAAPPSVLADFSVVILGVLALLFRQTNIFWVAIFPAGLGVIDALKAAAPSSASLATQSPSEVLKKSWGEGYVHDSSVEDASPQDYALLLLSVALAALGKPLLVLRVALSYVVLLGLFAGFVVWNGSVVLGDKSAHTATLHLPQMLYIWPYIAFFSAPLLLGPALKTAIALVPRQLMPTVTANSPSYTSEKLPALLISSLFVIGAFAAVHFNTIIHPYTLADNRHYVFYVFRILRRHPVTKYLVVPVYSVCAWLAVQALSTASNGEQALEKARDTTRPTSGESHRTPCKISFIFIWLVATTLSVITAPLVEPRYFIIPWIIWRLHVQSPASLSREGQPLNAVYDVRIGLETLWMLVIDATVTYIFIYRGFTWPGEPGKVQRFLW